MRNIIAVIILSLIADCAIGIPPVAADFMAGGEEARYLVWFHPELHGLEQGRDGQSEELNLAPGDEPARYSVVQKAEFPFMSCVMLFRTKINAADIFPHLPGDQYSSFGYSLYLDGDDSLPVQPPVFHGGNRLCGGVPCDEQWVDNHVGWPNLSGENLWFGLDWADSTPSAPQIKCLFLPSAEAYNFLGIKTSEYYDWQAISYVPVFRYQFLTPFLCDTAFGSGWRRRLEYDTKPDSFLIRCFDTAGDSLLAQFIAGTDTLITRLPDHKTDSVEIFAYYDNYLDGSPLALAFDEQLIGPICAEIDFEKNRGSGSFDLIVNNTGPSTLVLTFGHNGFVMENLPEEIILGGNQTAVLPVQTPLSESDSLDLMIVIRDKARQYYPFLVTASYPPQNPTEADYEQTVAVPDAGGIELYPNPVRDVLNIRTDKRVPADRIEIYNLIGQKVYAKKIPPGFEIIWDGRNNLGQKLPVGVYFVRIRDGENTVGVRKLILLQ